MRPWTSGLISPHPRPQMLVLPQLGGLSSCSPSSAMYLERKRMEKTRHEKQKELVKEASSATRSSSTTNRLDLRNIPPSQYSQQPFCAAGYRDVVLEEEGSSRRVLAVGREFLHAVRSGFSLGIPCGGRAPRTEAGGERPFGSPGAVEW